MIETLRTRLLAILQQPGMTKVNLAFQAGVHVNTLNGLSQANWNPNGNTIESLSAAADRLEKKDA